jgi:putative ABC transport system permease protein
MSTQPDLAPARSAFPPGARRGFFGHLLAAWTWRMAWRDTRTSRRKLALYSSSIVLGVAALAAIGALGVNLERAIEEQTKSLLGADLVLQSQDPFTPATDELFKSLGGEQAREISLTTMAYFPRTDNTRLVQVHALSGGFPFYGNLETQPSAAGDTLKQSGAGLLAEDTLLTQFESQVGDTIRIGTLTTNITGRLIKVPGETVGMSALAPRIYIPLDDLPKTGLFQPGSLARFAVYFKFGPDTDVTALVERLRPQLEKLHLRPDTVEERKRDLGRSMDNLYHFLNLVGFIALLLGGVGIASAIHVHIKQKLGTVAVLRCLGSSVSQTFAIYLAQGMALGLFGAVLGGALGLAIQFVLPKVLADFIPFTFQFHMAWLAIGRAMAIGFACCLMFSLLPLLAVRKVSPLAAIRVSFALQSSGRDPLRWLAGIVLAAGIVGFALMQTRDWRVGLGFAVALGVVFGILTLTAKILVAATRRFIPAKLPFTVRQGIANLHRPNNRTLLLLLSLGLGTFLMVSLYLVQQVLLKQLITSSGKNQPNAVLFDVQAEQVDPLDALIRSLGLPVLDETPIVTMRLSSVKGVSVDSLLSGEPRHGRDWVYRREYRSTYTDHLRDGEKIIAGKWVPQVPDDSRDPVPISLEDGIAKDLHVGLGDQLVFDIEGVSIPTRVASLREVEWRRIQPNFFVVFPLGVLGGAPAMYVMVTRVSSSQESARMQRAVVKSFPNVSVIDLTLVLQTVDAILNKISFVIRFMAMFTVLTGLVVLVSALAAGRYQRIQESILLRTLGASRGQILKILLVEYLALGFLSALTGIVLAVLAAGALTRFVFHVPFVWEWESVVIPLLLGPALTVVVGFLMSLGILNQSPLNVLRTEV